MVSSRGLGDVYKRQDEWRPSMTQSADQTTTVQTDVLVIGWGTADKTLAG